LISMAGGRVRLARAPAVGLPSTPETGPVQRLARSLLRPRGAPLRGRSARRGRYSARGCADAAGWHGPSGPGTRRPAARYRPTAPASPMPSYRRAGAWRPRPPRRPAPAEAHSAANARPPRHRTRHRRPPSSGWHFWEHDYLRDPVVAHALLAVLKTVMLVGVISAIPSTTTSDSI